MTQGDDPKQFLVETTSEYKQECEYLDRKPIPELIEDWDDFENSLYNDWPNSDANGEAGIYSKIKELEKIPHSRLEIIKIIKRYE